VGLRRSIPYPKPKPKQLEGVGAGITSEEGMPNHTRDVKPPSKVQQE